MTLLSDLVERGRGRAETVLSQINSLSSLAGLDDPGLSSGSLSSPDSVMDLVTRSGVTLDADAMRSLIQARKAGFNAFPYIISDYRSRAEQARLYANRGGRSIPVAKPGSSLHEQGIAIDAGNLPAVVRQYLIRNGWFWGNSFGDPPHYSFGESG